MADGVRKFDTRHRYLTTRLKEFLNIENEAAVEDYVLSERVLPIINDFFAAANNVNKLLFFYQPAQDVVDRIAAGADVDLSTVPFVFFMSTGEDVSIFGRAVYVMRASSTKPVGVANVDTDIVFNEIVGNPLESLQLLMNELLYPVMHRMEDWGKASVETRREYLSGANKFAEALTEAANSLRSGVELARPDRRFEVEPKALAYNRAAADPEVVAHYEATIAAWCDQVERVLREPERGRREVEEAGPNTELEYWRGRMGKFNSITEQLKTKECKAVIGVLTAARSGQLRVWRNLDNAITDAANEAKDNVKYLSTLEKYTEPLYTGNPVSIAEALPGLMNNLKMMHTISRYYNTSERMTTLLVKISNQVITNCKQYILQKGRMWDQKGPDLIERLEACLRLADVYQETYRVVQEKLRLAPKGRQFDFSEAQIFGRLELFCKRVHKLVDLFTTVMQFQSLAAHNIEGMESLTKGFFKMADDFKAKPYDLLDFTRNQFDRDMLEFNLGVHELEAAIQGFINASFENIASTESALALLKKFQAILHRDTLKSDLEGKYMVIFHNYGLDLETVQKIYEKQKFHPPMPRNAPPVAGNIAWSRQLLRRIEEPMKKFQTNKSIMTTKESRKIIRTFNRVARALIEFEMLWHRAWCHSIEAARAGLQATLIIRHPENGQLYVNFDREILQLVREAHALMQMGIAVPEAARMILQQEEKFKYYDNSLSFLLRERDRIVSRIPLVVRAALKPHMEDLESKIKPGMTSLSWTSMNIDGYLQRVHTGLQRFEELVSKIMDILENRVEGNLRGVSKALLVDLPANQSFTVDSFYSTQLKHIEATAALMDQKNWAVETAVGDLVATILSFPMDGDFEKSMVVSAEAKKLQRHYTKLMYTSVIGAIRNSLNLLKRRLGSRTSGGFLYVERPFFDVDIELTIPNVSMNPPLDDIQLTINRTAIAILRAARRIFLWGQHRDEAGAAASGQLDSFYTEVAREKEIVKVILLLTGSVEGIKNQVVAYLETFRVYDYLWKDDMQTVYNKFMAGNPSLEDFEQELIKYEKLDQEISRITPVHNLGALSLETKALKDALRREAMAWRSQYTRNLHAQAREELDKITATINDFGVRLKRPIKDIEDVRKVMEVLEEVRKQEAEADAWFGPVEDQYQLLKRYEVKVPKDEADQVAELRLLWKKLKKIATDVQDHLNQLQGGFKRDLIAAVKKFKNDVRLFREDYDKNGPMLPGLEPRDASERLRKFQRMYEAMDRKFETFSIGEQLFGLPVTDYPELKKTKKELDLLDKLYSLYVEVTTVIGGYSDILWADVVMNIEAMSAQVADFQTRCKKMPKGLRDWDAYKELKQIIDDFLDLLPLLQLLSNKAMRPRHWASIMSITGKQLNMAGDSLRLSHIMDLNLLHYKEEIEDIANGAVKETQIESKLKSITDDWADQVLTFANFKNRGPVLLKSQETSELIEKLEDSQMALGTMLSNRYVAPFREEAESWDKKLSTISEIIESWMTVQNLWINMEAVFASGDIAKQMPQEAKRFIQIDKNYMKIMNKAFEIRNVIQMCYHNDMLRSLLPHLTEQLELCQKSLSGYLEAKRNLFPRFYFVADANLLEILSQGSDPTAVQPHLQLLFDSIASVTFDRLDKNKITVIHSAEGESVPLTAPVVAAGNIEDWLNKLEKEMQRTLKDIVRNAAADCQAMPLDEFVERYPAQVTLLGLQLAWTADAEEALQRSKADKQIMANTNKKFQQVLAELTQSTTRELTRMDRTKVETLITIQVHQKDTFEALVRKKVRDSNDFEWQKCCRLYWKDDRDNCIISIADVDFEYCYEYLGCKERLVITPLTDRCYISLSQAIGMYLGGAPAGPAGTGKTETVKDLGRTLGKFVVVTNCSDQMDYRAMAKIFKGLAQSGAWGCFDEFNRIDLEVLSVVAQQIQCVLTAAREHRDSLVFTDGQLIRLDSRTASFITMNPGYAGRQELPENLKTLFRGVAMMVPDRQIIMKVKLAACGFLENTSLAKKFNVLYRLCEQQLSKQAHYDFGLRNILAVLRTAGDVKRADSEKPEIVLLMRTLRDMNLSKFVAEDVPLFMSLINDLFPGITVDKARYMDVENAIANQIAAAEPVPLQPHPDWVNKIVQFYEMSRVRHGLMVVGPSGSGKTRCIEILMKGLTETGIVHKELRMNPKAITAPQMFGRLDVVTNDWTDGIFAALWRKACKTKNHHTWITLDGPVDAVWIENLNTVLDDNKLLTLANGDRIPMGANMKLIFEVENLAKASPATVSRAGIIYISESELGWRPPMQSWLSKRDKREHVILKNLFETWIDKSFEFIRKECRVVIANQQGNVVTTVCNMLDPLLSEPPPADRLTGPTLDDFYGEVHLEKVFLYAMSWALAGVLELKDRIKFDQFLRQSSPNLPPAKDGDTIFEFVVDNDSLTWEAWTKRIPAWKYPEGGDPQFSTLFVPTMDSTRYEYLVGLLGRQHHGVLFVGGTGTAKTAVMQQYLLRANPETTLTKKVNFSSATTPLLYQRAIEGMVEKRQGRNFGPPGGKNLIVFMDDISMPDINEWGDQITNEIVRQLIEADGFYNLEKPGEWKHIIDLSFVAAMNQPGAGKNDIPNRLKRHFAIYNMTLPSKGSIDTMFGSILRGRFSSKSLDDSLKEMVMTLTEVTITLWERVAARMLPTPAKFHYLFNMRDLSRIFQGILYPPRSIVASDATLLSLWKHECDRVFSDRFVDAEDKKWFEKAILAVAEERYGPSLAKALTKEVFWVDFMRDAYDDPETGELISAPKVYEPIEDVKTLRARLDAYMKSFNEESRIRKLDLVLFHDAIRHLVRISRIIRMDRGSALLVGVGGSGKQSLTRLASYIAGYHTFQITLTKSYGVGNLLDDLRTLYKFTGLQGKGMTFIFTDAEVKDESFLEFINNLLSTGEVPNLFQKDEIDMIVNDLRTVVKAQQKQGFFKDFIDTYDNLYKLFIDRVRDNLHVVLCFSPVGEKFRVRARKFPGLINCCTVDWFMPWPEEALKDVASRYIGEFKMECTPSVKQQLVLHMASVHSNVSTITHDYFSKFRRHVYVTPKTYLSFLQAYRTVYNSKFGEVSRLANNVKVGLEKLLQAGEDVTRMKVELQAQEIELVEAQRRSAALLTDIQQKTAIAEKKKKEVLAKKESCDSQAAVVSVEKDEAERELAAAKPALEEAKAALNQISQKDIVLLKQLRNPPELIRRIFDGVLVLLWKPLGTVRYVEYKGRKLLGDSYETSLRVMGEPKFMDLLIDYPKDNITDEQIELLQPYLAMEDFTYDGAKKAAGAIAGLCAWIRAMGVYTACRKDVGPKLEALMAKESKLRHALQQVSAAEGELAVVQADLDARQREFEQAMHEKQVLQDKKELTARRMEVANELIGGLAGEKVRWTQQSKEFADIIRRLVGDVALACSFVNYCGPFNQEFRELLLHRHFYADCMARAIPVTEGLQVTKFMATDTQKGEWILQGLPTDELSIQNGIMVTVSSRYPILIDPQGQGVQWIKNREEKSGLKVTQLTDKNFRQHLEECLSFGRPLLIENIEEEIDPLLDPVLEKSVQRTSKGGAIIVLADKEVDYVDGFALYMTTKLANPHFSPELSAKVTVVDFTVTMKGLEDQLLGRVVQKERQELEEQRQQLLQEVQANTKKIKELEDDLLLRLSSSQGNLLDDVSLIEVLNNTKHTAQEVNDKLLNSVETEKKIDVAREEYRGVANRGAVLYFVITETSLINVMYQTSLAQFLKLFDLSIATADKAAITTRRVHNIMEVLTYNTYAFISRGLFERHKLLFSLLVALKIQLAAQTISPLEFGAFLKAGASLDIKDARKKPYPWLPDQAWLNVIAIGQSSISGPLADLADSVCRAEQLWKPWYDAEAPEGLVVPEYQERLEALGPVGRFYRLCIVRAIREDRTMLAAQEYIEAVLGRRFVEGQPLSLDATWAESAPRVPLVCLLSPGSDPTKDITELARKKKKPVASISMGQGQEVQARKLIATGMAQGNWVLLQNCHLGLKFLLEVESTLLKAEEVDSEFRLWITSEPHARFPIGLLQMAIKITNEAPQGMRAGLKRSYQWINQDMLDAVGRSEWRSLLFTLCFLHSAVQERRKFGPLGWNVPYEFNQSDLEACVKFLQNHLTTVENNAAPGKRGGGFGFGAGGQALGAGISWVTVRYMVAEIQYGGRITDDMDRRLFNTYADTYLAPRVFEADFLFYTGYRIPQGSEIQKFRSEIDSLPIIDNPEIFGLHANADLTFRTKEAKAALATALETQPKGGGGAGGVTREEAVLKIADDLLARMPPDFNRDATKEKLAKQGGTRPLSIFVGQEVERLQLVIAAARRTLQELKLAIAGTVVMSADLQDALNALYDARVPTAWTRLSWPSPTVGAWFAAFLQRTEQLTNWVNLGRPPSYWLAGFFNPQGFLTAVKQEVTRKHSGWALDDVVFSTEVTKLEREEVREAPPEGVYVHGLFLEGAAWDRRLASLVDAPPKVLFVPLPVLFVTAIVASEKAQGGQPGSNTSSCELPCYKLPTRTDLNLVFAVDMPTVDAPQKWILRGAAILCSKE